MKLLLFWANFAQFETMLQDLLHSVSVQAACLEQLSATTTLNFSFMSVKLIFVFAGVD